MPRAPGGWGSTEGGGKGDHLGYENGVPYVNVWVGDTFHIVVITLTNGVYALPLDVALEPNVRAAVEELLEKTNKANPRPASRSDRRGKSTN